MRMKRGVPDVGDVAGEQRPRLAPVAPVVVGNLAYRSFRVRPIIVDLCSPRRIVLHSVGWIRDHEKRHDAAKASGNVLGLRGVAAQQAVIAKLPQLPCFYAPLDAQFFGLVDLRLCVNFAFGFGEIHQRKKRLVEPKFSHVDLNLSERVHFRSQHIQVPPATEFRKPVVGQDVGPPLVLVQVRQADARHFRQPQLHSRQHPPVAGHDPVVLRYENRVVEPELAD